jgi:hypothetical protein
MDTKTLHDLALDAKIDLRNEDSYHDCVAVWIDEVFRDPKELLDDIWLDALAEIQRSKNETSVNSDTRERLFRDMESCHTDLNRMENSNSPMINSCYATSYGFRTMNVGETLFFTIRKYVIKYVEERAEDWFGDVQGYAGDMEEAMADDAADSRYEDRKDRMLDER